jgi:ABC-type multidrug transport system ATPase subunit
MDLSIEGVGKRYRGGLWALRGVSLRLEPGIVGLLGPNGAGKSTLMRILATVTRPTEGRVVWDGADLAAEPDRLRRVLGYLPQDFGVYPNLSAAEFLRYLAAAKGLPAGAAARRIDELLAAVHLAEARGRKLGGFSGGMRQRVGIAQALLNDPSLLIVDEPTVGLDPEERVGFRHLLSELGGERVVILSTHIVSDVEAVADRIVVMEGGRVVADGLPEELLAGVAGRVWSWEVAAPELPAVRRSHLLTGAIRKGGKDGGVRVRVVAAERPVAAAEPDPPTLEDAYLDLVERSRARPAA